MSAHESPARVYPVYGTFCIALLSILLGSAVLMLVWVGPDFASRGAGAVTMGLLLASVLVSSGACIAAAVVPGVLSPLALTKRLSLTRPAASPGLLLLVALGAPALGTVLEAVLVLLEVEPSGSLELIEKTFRSTSGALAVLGVTVLSLAPGLGEELLFRGYIQTRLVERHGPLPGIVIAALLFGLLHLDPVHSPLAALLGLYLGYVAYRLRSLWPAVLAHVVNNAVAASSIYIYPEDPSLSFTLTAAALGLVVAAAAIWALLRAGALAVPDPAPSITRTRGPS